MNGRMKLSIGLLAALLIAPACGPQDESVDSQQQKVAVAWGSAVGVSVNGASITKTNGNGWTAGAISTQDFTGDGYVEFTTAENNTAKMAGLSAGNSNQYYSDIDFAVYMAGNGYLYIYEGGVSRGLVGTYAANDVFRVAAVSGVVSYYQNGNLIYTSSVAPSATLLLDTSIYTTNATINNADITATAGAAVWQNEVGVSSSGNSITKTGGAGWNSGASTVATLPGDGYVEFMTGETTTSKICGLSSGDSNQAFADVDYGVYMTSGGLLYIYEAGVYRIYLGTYAATDTFRITVASGVVTYRRNGNLIYTSTVPASGALLFDSSLYTPGATVNNVTFTSSGGSSFWQNTSGVTTSTNSLTKAWGTGWSAGASTVSSLAADGYVEFTTAETNTSKMAGLSNGDSNYGYQDIDYAFYLSSGGLVYIYEGGVYRKAVGSYQASDVFRVQTLGGVVNYYQNGILRYTSAVPSSGALLFDTSLSTVGATINNVTFTDITGTPTWLNQSGVTASTNNLTKTAGAGWNAGASTSETLAADGYVEFTTAENNTAKIAGLSNGDSNQTFGDIDFGIYLTAAGAVYIYEGGAYRTTTGSYAASDVFRINVTGTTVTYLQNGNLIYTSGVSPTSPLLFDTSLYTTGATINGVVFTPAP